MTNRVDDPATGMASETSESAQPRRIHDEMRAAAGPQPHVGVELARPHPGRIEHDTGANPQLRSGERIAQECAVAVGGDRLDTREDGCAVPGGRPRDGDDQPCVVDELAVPAAHPAAEGLGADRGRETQHLGPADRPGGAEHRVRGADDSPHAVAHAIPDADVCSSRYVARRVQRQDLRHRSDEMRSDPREQQVPLRRALVRDADLARCEVAQAAVDELRAPATRTVREVAPLDQHGPKAAARGIQRYPCAGGAAADHQHVDVGFDASASSSRARR